jgi:hypothetical protein
VRAPEGEGTLAGQGEGSGFPPERCIDGVVAEKAPAAALMSEIGCGGDSPTPVVDEVQRGRCWGASR